MSKEIEYKHRAVVFCPVCKNCCEAGKDPELGLVVICSGCQYKEASKEAVVYQSAAASKVGRHRLPPELAFDRTRPLVRQNCPSCSHSWARKIQKDSANPYGELGVLFVCTECRTFFEPARPRNHNA